MFKSFTGKLITKKKSIIFTILIAGLFATGCVSQKEHSQAIKRLDYLENQNRGLAKQNAQLRSINELVSVEVNEALADKYAELAEKAARRGEHIDIMYDRLARSKANYSALMDSLQSKFALFLPEEVELVDNDGNLHVQFADLVFFESNKAKLSAAGKATLSDLAFVLNNQENEFDIQVVGHADPRKIKSEKHRDNWGLSMKRALAVVRELERNGVNPELLTASAKSYFEPFDDGQYETGLRADRRAEIIFIPRFEHEVYEILFGAR